MSAVVSALKKAVTTCVSKVVGGLFFIFRNLVVHFQNFRTRNSSNTRITQWERSAKYTGWAMAKCHEDLTKTVFYLFAYNKRNENTLTMAVYQGKAVGCEPELHLYTKDKETGNVNEQKLPFEYDVKVLKDIFDLV